MITPDVEAVRIAVTTPGSFIGVNWSRPAERDIDRILAAARAASVQYAITVVEGMPCYSERCSGWCDRCAALAELQAIIDRAGEQGE